MKKFLIILLAVVLIIGVFVVIRITNNTIGPDCANAGPNYKGDCW